MGCAKDRPTRSRRQVADDRRFQINPPPHIPILTPSPCYSPTSHHFPVTAEFISTARSGNFPPPKIDLNEPVTELTSVLLVKLRLVLGSRNSWKGGHMSELWKSEKELEEERRHEETLAEIKKGAIKQSQSTQQAAKMQVEALAESSRIQARTTREALERQTSELVEATYDSAELVAGHFSKAIAEEWVLQAEGKAKRACELLVGGMVEEAWELAKEAIQQDPGHLPGYIVAAYLHHVQGEFEEADRLYKKQIKLLRVTPYDSDLRWPIAVLRQLPAHPHLLAAFSVCAESLLTAERWRWGSWEEFILLLRERGLQELAKAVVVVAVDKEATFKLHALNLELSLFADAACRAFEEYLATPSFEYQKKLVAEYESLRLEESVSEQTIQAVYNNLLKSQLQALKGQPSMPNYAFHIEFSQGWNAAQESFAKYISVDDVQSQNELLGQLAELFRSEMAPSDGLLLMRSIFARQFELWQPVRQRCHQESATTKAERRIGGNTLTLAGIVGAAILVIIYHILTMNSPIAALAPLVIFGGLICFVTFLAVIYEHRNSMVRRESQRQHDALWASERKWAEWLGAKISKETRATP